MFEVEPEYANFVQRGQAEENHQVPLIYKSLSFYNFLFLFFIDYLDFLN